LSFAAITAPPGEADDLHVVLGAQLADHRAEDAGADRLVVVVDQHRGVAVEPDRAAVFAAHFLGGADDDRLADVAFLDAAPRDRFLDRHHDDVAHGGVFPLGAAEHLDALDPSRARIVGDVQIGLHLDHGRCS
jgi:hypothetical protein